MKRSAIVPIVVLFFIGLNFVYSQESHSVLADQSIEGSKVEYLTASASNRDAMIGYMVNLRSPNTGFYSFPVPAFSPFTLVATPNVSGAYAADIGPGGVYYAIKDSSVDTLYTINKMTGAFSGQLTRAVASAGSGRLILPPAIPPRLSPQRVSKLIAL